MTWFTRLPKQIKNVESKGHVGQKPHSIYLGVWFSGRVAPWLPANLLSHNTVEHRAADRREKEGVSAAG